MPFQKVDAGVTLSRHSILNKFLVATVCSGLLAAVATTWRDVAVGISLSNSAMNISLVIILSVAWFYRSQLSVVAKSSVLFITYFLVGCKNIYLFGPHSMGIVFLGYCCMILALVLQTKWAITFAVLISLVIPIRAILHFEDILPVQQDFDNLLASASIWAAMYSNYFLTAFIIALGVGQLRLELNKNFGLLRLSVIDLEAANKNLKNEIELKNAYEEELLVSNKKFFGLFEGSRDGVLLLNSKAHIIEANPAALDMSGYSLDELKDVNIFNLVEESYRKMSMERFQQNMLGEIPQGLMEVLIVSKDGRTIAVEINSNLILAEDELLVLSTVRDISYRKIAENEKFNAALAAEERERERFSKDLHDDLGPVFSTLNLYLQTLSSKESDPSKKEILNNLSGIVDSAVKQVREISHNLSPYLLRDAGLVEAIRTHLKKYSSSGIDAELQILNMVENPLPHSTEVVLYRVFLELLNNTLKHAQANKISIQLSWSVKEIIFNYADNGVGFSQGEHPNAGIGLKNIENRVKAINGSLKFVSEGYGMSALVRIPL
jgi:PAS domain S-box-containing protein